MARKYQLNLDLVREASDAEVVAAVRRVLCWAHPDKSGSEDDTKELNAARDEREDAKRNRRGPGAQQATTIGAGIWGESAVPTGAAGTPPIPNGAIDEQGVAEILLVLAVPGPTSWKTITVGTEQ